MFENIDLMMEFVIFVRFFDLVGVIDVVEF